MYLKEAIDDLYICATNYDYSKSFLKKGYYEECFDRVMEELDKQEEIIDLMAEEIIDLIMEDEDWEE